jgi:hypothetical protein
VDDALGGGRGAFEVQNRDFPARRTAMESNMNAAHKPEKRSAASCQGRAPRCVVGKGQDVI